MTYNMLTFGGEKVFGDVLSASEYIKDFKRIVCETNFMPNNCIMPIRLMFSGSVCLIILGLVVMSLQ